MFFCFGTPIGNRTLVSAVRGRRLEPLDHEGKSILLCDNIIILHLMQANADMFPQKSVVCDLFFIDVACKAIHVFGAQWIDSFGVLFEAFRNHRRKTRSIPTNLRLPPTYTKNSFFISFAPYNTICIFIAICSEQTSKNMLKKLSFLIKIYQI